MASATRDADSDIHEVKNKRDFQEIGISVTCVWPASRRFPRTDPNKPKVAAWRNNLAGLSHNENLLFIAYNFDEIYVYEPYGQFEYLDKPELILKLPVSRPGLRGYIDDGHPHGINHLIIDKLGHEEVMLVACDDGDVIAYYISDVKREILSRASSNASIIPAPTDHILRPFFLENVGLSAWGLAIHAHARQIAVSCNTGIVHVFAFGLTTDLEYPHDVTQHDTRWPVVSHLTRHENPAQNFHVQLRGHGGNIPTVAFDNSGQDPEGRYLVSAQIGQEGIVWDLWGGITSFFEHGTFGGPSVDEQSQEGPARNWGWSVLCVDSASYWPSQGSLETFGCSEPYFWKQESRQWDNTLGAALIPGNVPRRPMRANTVNYDNEEVFRGSARVLTEANLVNAARSEIERLRGKKSNTRADPRDIYSIRSTRPARLPSDDISDSTKDEMFHEGWGVVNPEYPYRPHFDILICTSKDIGLIYRTEPGRLDRINCSDPLSRQAPLEDDNVHVYHRLNMALQIRELGIVIVGDQAGRVAVISLNKMRDAPRIKGFRIDRILPTWGEEKSGHRQTTALVGMALGPVNPSEEGIDRTWRLMLFYRDHTILVYNIWRKYSRGNFGDSDGG